MKKGLIVIALFIILMPVIGISQNKELKLQHGKTVITAVHFTPNGKNLVSSSFNGTVILWDIHSGKSLWKFDLDANSKVGDRYTISEIGDMSVSADDRTIAVSYSQATVIKDTLQADDIYQIALLNVKNGQVIKIIKGHTFLIGGIIFSPNGKSLLSVGGDQTARLWNVDSGEEIFQIKLKEQGGTAAFSPDGKQFAIVTAPIWGDPPQPIVGLYEAVSGNLLREFPRQYSEVTGIAFSPDGKYLAIGGFNMPNCSIKLWDISNATTQEPADILTERERLVANHIFSPDGKLIVYSEFQNGVPAVSIRQLSPNRKIKTYKADAEVNALDISPDGMKIAFGTRKGQIILENIK